MGDMVDMLNEDYGDDEDYGEPFHPLQISCKYCGTIGLVWGQDSFGKWRLVDITNKVHTCNEYSEKEEQNG
jgi:hypothetical protein